MEFLFLLIGFVVAVLQIILFFKLWGMTNDVRRIVVLLEPNCSDNSPESVADLKNGFSINQLVVLKSTEDQMRIVSFPTDDTVECRNVINGKINTYQKEKIEDFDKYWAEKKVR